MFQPLKQRLQRTPFSFAVLALTGICGISAVPASADTISEGFENSAGSYNLATQAEGSASIVTSPGSPVNSGSQALKLSLTNSSDYARVKLDITSQAVTLGQILSADYWVDRTAGATSGELPYLILSINTPGSGGDSTLAVLYNNPSAFGASYTDMTVGLNSVFHIEGDTTGLSNASGITLGDLENSTYSAGVSWGSFAVDYVRIGYGQAGNDGIASTSYVDDLTINTAPPAPAGVPDGGSTAALLGLAMTGMAWVRRKVS